MLNKKVKKAFEHNLTPILCCGETLEQREMGVTLDWIRLADQIGLKGYYRRAGCFHGNRI